MGKGQGDLDPTFNAPNGYALYSGWNRDSYMGTAIQTDGKILVSTGISNGRDSDVAVLRYYPDGSLDTTFGTGGVVIYEGGKGNDGFRDMAVESDGKIVVTGYTRTDAGFEALTARYDAAGILDRSFGIDGIVRYDGGHGNAGARGIVVQTDGRIVVSGSNNNGTDLDVIVLRYDSDGSMDPDFGTGGVVVYDGGNGNNNGRRVCLQQGDRIVVVGNAHNGEDYDGGAARTRISVMAGWPVTTWVRAMTGARQSPWEHYRFVNGFLMD